MMPQRLQKYLQLKKKTSCSKKNNLPEKKIENNFSEENNISEKKIINNCLRSEKTNEIYYTTEKSNCTMITALFFYRCQLIDNALSYHTWIHNYRWFVYVPMKKEKP